MELFTAGLRDGLRPPFDPVVDACTPAFRAADLLDGFSERILDRHPSVVFLICGAVDSASGLRALATFEHALLRTARRLEEEGVVLALNTSPVPFCPDDDPSAATHVIYAEAVRGVATELGLPLVDHQREWEQFAVPPGGDGSWFSPNGREPSGRGHRQIALKLLAAIAGSRVSATNAFNPLAATWE